MRGNKTGSPLGLKLIRPRLSDLIPATPLMSLHCRKDHTVKIPSCTGDLRVNFYDLAGVYFQPLLLSCRCKVEQAYSLRLFTILQLYLGHNWKILSADDILRMITASCLCRTMFSFLGDNMRKYLILRSQWWTPRWFSRKLILLSIMYVCIYYLFVISHLCRDEEMWWNINIWYIEMKGYGCLL